MLHTTPHLFLTLLFLFTSFALNIARAETGSVNAEIEKFLMDNPAILYRALENMQDYMQSEDTRRSQAEIEKNADKLYRDKRDYVIGHTDASVTIVEFFDYNCGYCKRSFPVLLEAIQKNSDVRVVFKEMPILGASSRQAAQIALAAKKSGKYFDIHQSFLESRRQLAPEVFNDILGAHRLSGDKITRLGKQKDVQQHIDDTLKLARTLGISGTPTFIINDKLYPGALSYEDLQQAIDTARQAALN